MIPGIEPQSITRGIHHHKFMILTGLMKRATDPRIPARSGIQEDSSARFWT
jgi:hypothetical protein